MKTNPIDKEQCVRLRHIAKEMVGQIKPVEMYMVKTNKNLYFIPTADYPHFNKVMQVVAVEEDD